MNQAKQAVNPYLPSYEYVPDGEPHVFNGRVYVYGSHDRFGGNDFCLNDYVCWSARADDLANWRYEGTSYRSVQDPLCAEGSTAMRLFAPDVQRGGDGRYYLFYALEFCGRISVAVSESPVGPFHDMCSVREAPQIVLPQQADAEGTEFAEHPFFEAPSLRKANGRYYLIYSSTQIHELCYAVADKPQGVYHYGGTIVSNGDIGLDGRTVPCNYTGTNHGSIVEINGQWYVFYHRQTNRTPYSRQGCAEKITLLPDGSIPQVRVTSCGLNDGPLKSGYSYPAGIACCLQTANGAGPYRAKTTIGEEHPYITQDGPDGDIFAQQYVANLRDGSNAGYRSFLLHPGTNLTVTYRCTGDGTLEIAAKESGASALVFPVTASNTWQTAMGTLQLDGEQELWFTYRGTGALDLRGFKL